MSLDLFPGASLSPAAETLIRTAYGALLFATLAMTLPQSRWFFVSERYGGYARSGGVTDAIQNPVLLPFFLAFWLLCAAMIAVGYQTVWFGLANLLLCRYFFIQMRWKGSLRGMGAPGFIAYWLAACVFFLEYSLRMDPGGPVQALALLVFRLDFAAILLSAGFYKLLCGYPQGEGMEYGMVNPWWGYWWRWYRRMPPAHFLFKVLDHLAYGTEIAAGVLLIVPATRVLGALLVIGSFFFIATHIRLGFLCEMVMVAGLLYIGSGSAADRFLSAWVAAAPPLAHPAAGLSFYLNRFVAAFLCVYLLMLPFAHAGLWYNLLARKRLPSFFQKGLEAYTNFFGIIIWRVFSVDVINFFASIYVVDAGSGERKPYSRFGALDWGSRFRYLHVGESICLASIFTTLKYYPSNGPLFQERLLRYAKTIPCPRGSKLLFEYTSIRKSKTEFEFIPAMEYLVDRCQESIEEKLLDRRFSAREPDRVSPVHEGARPGSYAPLQGSKKGALSK